MPSRRQSILIVTTVLVCCYTVSVFWYVYKFPDIGLRCMFEPVVQKVHDGYVRGFEGTPAPDGDLEGYRIVQVDDRPIELWPQLLRALRDLSARDPVVFVEDLAQAQGHTFVKLGEEELVLVRLEKPGSPPVAAWCVLGHTPFDLMVPSLLWVCLNLGLFLVAAMLYWNRPNDRSATRFFWLAIVTVGAFVGGNHWTRLLSNTPLFLVYLGCSLLLPAVSLHFYMVFPRPKRVLRRHPRLVLAALYGVPLAFWAVLAAGYLYIRSLMNEGAGVEAIQRPQPFLMAVTYAFLGVAALLYLLSIACLVHSYTRATDFRERKQVLWIMIGALVALVPVGYTLYLATWERNDFAAGGGTWPMFAASVCFTAAFTISLTRYRLMQLDQYMAYFLVSFLFGLAYYGLVFLGMLLVGSRFITGPSFEQALWVSIMTLVLMLILDLGRSRLKKVLDRSFDRQKVQLDQTLQRMGQAIEQLVDPPTLARRLLQTAGELLGVSRGAIYLRTGEPPLYRLIETLGPTPPLGELAFGCPLVDALQARGAVTALARGGASDPVRTQLRLLGGEVAQAMSHEGRLIALLILGSKNIGPYTSEDLNLLAAFAQMTALALENAEGHRTIEELNRELQAKVEKISEQQRRILALQSQLQTGGRGPGAGGRRPPADGEQGAVPASPPEIAPPAAAKGIIGTSPVVRHLLQLVRKAASARSEVLIRGESGTGKELLARALHEYSPRAAQPFVKVHCAALAPGLLESELFGHVKGAFTGAHRDKVGRFELADGGTLFLDEIGDINMEVQTKLLRVLEEMTFERVGSSEPVQVDVRLIAATHQNLEQLIQEGRFREDLYYRLNVISIRVPPLRERVEDVPELALHFLRLYAQRCGKPVTQIDDDALALLKGYAWPGNIRQLENVIERAVVVAEGSVVTVRELPEELQRGVELRVAPSANGEQVPRSGLQTERGLRDQRERERLVRALAAAAGNKAEAARALGLARSTLLSRLKKHGLS
jgi:transcriptional regulator with GAF, ATPase, and Fis domain